MAAPPGRAGRRTARDGPVTSHVVLLSTGPRCGTSPARRRAPDPGSAPRPAVPPLFAAEPAPDCSARTLQFAPSAGRQRRVSRRASGSRAPCTASCWPAGRGRPGGGRAAVAATPRRAGADPTSCSCSPTTSTSPRCGTSRTCRRSSAAQGTTFDDYFVSNSLCCPSRTTTLRGQYAHNTGVWTNGGDNGGFERAHANGVEQDTVATRLHRRRVHDRRSRASTSTAIRTAPRPTTCRRAGTTGPARSTATRTRSTATC